ncbi:MAG: hypothetical protein J6C37_03345 [Roseburia sp.]|nr:hypothetical protein [Roseburia sp.]
MEYIISYDIGTSGIKCGLFDADLNCCIITRCNYEVKMTVEGTAEAEPEDYIRGMVCCTREALERSGIPAKDICSMCTTTQGETLIPVDGTGQPLYKAIVWLDGRAAQEADFIREHFPDTIFREKTGLPGVDGYVPLAKLMHIRQKMPEVYEKTAKFMLLEDYVIFRLTGRTVSEKSLLSSTGYFDLNTDELWLDALDVIGINPGRIPDVVEPGQRIGCLTAEAARLLGLTCETVVYAGAMDQLAGAVGCGNCNVGDVHETTGTAMIVASTMGLRDCMACDKQLTVYRHVQKERYLLLAISKTATTVLKWFAEQFYQERKEEDIYAYLSSIVAEGTPGANGVIMIPYFEGMIGAEQSKGVFWNIGLHNTREDFVRAIFEGVSYMLKDNIRLMSGGNEQKGSLISIGGAARSDIWCQIKADVTGKEIVTMSQEESALFGCACIAAVGSGRYPSYAEAAKVQGESKRYIPNSTNAGVYEKEYEKYNKMKGQLVRLYQEL